MKSSFLKYAFGFNLLGKPYLKIQRLIDGYRMKGVKFPPEHPLNPPLKSGVYLKEIMARHYLEGRYVEGIKKVVWATSGAPVEPLRDSDFSYFIPKTMQRYAEQERLLWRLRRRLKRRGFQWTSVPMQEPR